MGLGRCHMIVLVSCLTHTLTCSSQVFDWNHTYGGTSADSPTDIRRCSDGGYVIVGNTLSNDGDVSGNHDPEGHAPDIWLLKLDSAGQFEWQHCYGSGAPQYAGRVAVMADHGFMIVGTAEGNSDDVDGNHGGKDGWVVRTDSVGNMLWQRCLGGSLNDELRDLVVQPDGGAVLVGFTKSNDGDVAGLNGSVEDVWLVRIGPEGEVLWQHCFDNAYGNDYGQALVQLADGTFTIAGERYYGVQCPWGSYEMWLFNADSLGNVNWSACAGGGSHEFAQGLAHCADGGYAMVGYTWSNDHHAAGNHDASGAYEEILVVRTDGDGAVLWSRPLGGSNMDLAYRVAELPNGGIRIIGRAFSTDGDVVANHGWGDVFMADLSADGTLEGTHCFGGSSDDVGLAFLLEEEGRMVVAAAARSYNGDVTDAPNGYYDVWVFATSDDLPMIVPEEASSEVGIRFDQATRSLIFDHMVGVGADLLVSDVMGRPVIDHPYPVSTDQLALPALAAGVYLASVITPTGQRSLRFVVEN